MKNYLFITALLFIYLSSDAQIFPIPKYRKDLSEINTIKTKNNIPDKKISYKIISNHKIITYNLSDSSLQSVEINEIARNLTLMHDTLVFDAINNQTIYMVKKNNNKITIVTTPSIKTENQQQYFRQVKKEALLNEDLDNLNKIIDSLNSSTLKLDEDNDLQFIKYSKKRDALKQEIVSSQHFIDSLIADISFDISSHHVFLPIGYSFYQKRKDISKIFNNYYYGRSDFSALQALEISRAAGITNLSTELANGFFKTFRISLAANINSVDKNDTSSIKEDQSDIQRLLSNGGQAAFRISTPLVFIRNMEDNIHLILSFQNQFSSDVIKEDSNSKNYKISNSIGGQLYFDIGTDDRQWTLYGCMPFAYIFGNTKFYENFEFRDMNVVQLNLGLAYKNQFRIKFSGAILSSQKSIMTVPWSVGFLFTPPSDGD